MNPLLYLPIIPTVYINLGLGSVPRREIPVRIPDPVGTIIPMYNEEEGAQSTIRAFFSQTEFPEQLVISENGSRDGTARKIHESLTQLGLEKDSVTEVRGLEAMVERWSSPYAPIPVHVIRHEEQTAKAESINRAVEHFMRTPYVMTLDGDVQVKQDFTQRMRDNLVQMRSHGNSTLFERMGTVTCAARPERQKGEGWQGTWIRMAREAEYPITHQLMRRGMTRRFDGNARSWLGQHFTHSRNFTVTGAGFIAHRSEYPMPTDTLTEDHDFTIGIQERGTSWDHHLLEQIVDGEAKVRTSSGLVPVIDVIGDTRIETVSSGRSLIAPGAMLISHEPTTVKGYVSQTERWLKGAWQVFYKRNADATMNNKYAMRSVMFENFLGLGLSAAFPTLIAMHAANPDLGFSARTGAMILGLDVSAATTLSAVGGYRMWRDEGESRTSAARKAVTTAIRSAPSLNTIRYITPFVFSAATVSEGINHLRGRVSDGSWERSHRVRKTLTGRLAPLVLAGYLGVVSAGAGISSLFNEPSQLERLASAGSEHVIEASYENRNDLPSSTFCDPSITPELADLEQHLAHAGDPEGYQPLTEWGLLYLSRIAPLADIVDRSAQSYGTNVDLMNRIILNESAYEPLALGTTDDKGLGQHHPEAEALLAGLSIRSGPYENRFFVEPHSVWDPFWNLCATSLKARFAQEQTDDGFENAYAFYINPEHGTTSGQVAPGMEFLSGGVVRNEEMSRQILATYAAHEHDPASIRPIERALIEAGRLDTYDQEGLRSAYERVVPIADAAGIDTSVQREFLDWMR